MFDIYRDQGKGGPMEAQPRIEKEELRESTIPTLSEILLRHPELTEDDCSDIATGLLELSD
jgi:hypothetical protein